MTLKKLKGDVRRSLLEAISVGGSLLTSVIKQRFGGGEANIILAVVHIDGKHVVRPVFAEGTSRELLTWPDSAPAANQA